MQIAIVINSTEYSMYSPEGLSQAAADQELQAIIGAMRDEEDFIIRPWCIVRTEEVIAAHICDDPKDLNDIISLIREDESKDDE